MIAKVILVIFIIALIGVSSWFLYQNIPGEAVVLKGNKTNNAVQNLNQTSEVKMFYSNMRFEERNISYFIDSSCSNSRRDKITEAFAILSQRTGILIFYVSDENNSEILIGCSREYLTPEQNVVVAGEGGPTKIIDTGEFNIVLKGRITLYKNSGINCDFPVVEIHEILHVFGFDHSEDSTSVLYPYSSCDQKITKDIIFTLQNLYSIEQLADLFFLNIDATKRGRYLDFNVEIKNSGLKSAENVSLNVFSEGEFVSVFDVGNVDVGSGRLLQVSGEKLPSRDSGNIVLVINYNQPELDTKNNVAYLNVI